MLRIEDFVELNWDLAIEAAARFGVDKAEIVMSACEDALRSRANIDYDSIQQWVKSETGYFIRSKDIEFVRVIAEAKDAIRHAHNIVTEALENAQK